MSNRKKESRRHQRELNYRPSFSQGLQDIFNQYTEMLRKKIGDDPDSAEEVFDANRPNLDKLSDKIILTLALDNPELMEERLKTVGADPSEEVLDAVQKALEARLGLAAILWWQDLADTKVQEKATEEAPERVTKQDTKTVVLRGSSYQVIPTYKVGEPRRHTRGMRIRRCAKEDYDLERPAEEQRFCLYASDGSLKGRHPDRGAAERQQQAIYNKQRSGSMERTAIIKRCREQDRKSGRKYPVAEQKWCLWDRNKKKILFAAPSRKLCEEHEKDVQYFKHQGETAPVEDIMSGKAILIGNTVYRAAEDKPKGWTKKSFKEYLQTMTGDAKHKFTKCVKELKGADWLDDPSKPEGYCGYLLDQTEPGWREGPRKSSATRNRRSLVSDPENPLRGRGWRDTYEPMKERLRRRRRDPSLHDEEPVELPAPERDRRSRTKGCGCGPRQVMSEELPDVYVGSTPYRMADEQTEMPNIHEDVVVYEKYGPGKFDDNIAEFVYEAILDGWSDPLGDEGFGMYDLVTYDQPVLVKQEGNEWTFQAAIVWTRSDGIVEVTYYDTVEEAQGIWAELELDYEKHLEKYGDEDY